MCGARDWNPEVPPPWPTRAAHWFLRGMRTPPGQQSFVCGTCGSGVGVAVFGFDTGTRRPRRWFALRRFRSRRSMTPAPYLYVAAAALGALVGVAAHPLLRWRWWIPMVALPAAVWVFFAASVFRAPGGGWAILRSTPRPWRGP